MKIAKIIVATGVLLCGGILLHLTEIGRALFATKKFYKHILSKIFALCSQFSSFNSEKLSRFHLGVILTALTGKSLTIETVKIDGHTENRIGQQYELANYMTNSSWLSISLYMIGLPKCEKALEIQYPGLKEKALEIWEREKCQDSLEKIYKDCESNDSDVEANDKANFLAEGIIKKFCER